MVNPEEVTQRELKVRDMIDSLVLLARGDAKVAFGDEVKPESNKGSRKPNPRMFTKMFGKSKEVPMGVFLALILTHHCLRKRV